MKGCQAILTDFDMATESQHKRALVDAFRGWKGGPFSMTVLLPKLSIK
jgi:hypothetical protein